MYNTIYNLIVGTLFEGTAITGEIELVVTLVSLACVLFVLSVPFVCVIKVIQLIFGR